MIIITEQTFLFRARVTHTFDAWKLKMSLAHVIMNAHVITNWNIERVDIYIFSTEFCHKTNVFLVISWSDFYVIFRSNLYFLSLSIATLYDWLKKLSPLCHPIRSRAKTNRDSFARVLPHLASATRNCFELWLVHWFLYVFCQMVLLFRHLQLKSALWWPFMDV